MGVTNAMVEATLATRYNSSGISLGTIWDGDYNYGVCLKGTNADSSAKDRICRVAGLSFAGLLNFATSLLFTSGLC